MSEIDMAATPSAADIANAYRLALGREPESEAVVAERLDQPRSTWLPAFFLNEEFRRLRATVLAGGALGNGFAHALPTAELRGWAVAALPLSPAGRAAVDGTSDWFGLFHAIFSDPDFAAALPALAEFTGDGAFLTALAARRRAAVFSLVEGAVELVAAGEVRGWATDLRDPERLLALELHIDGRFVAAGTTGLVRRELQERFGGSGRGGFAIGFAASPAEPGRPVVLEVREATSGLVIGTARLPDPEAPPVDAVAELRADVAALRALLERIEKRLPAVHESLSVPLDGYSGYRRAYYEPAERAVPRGAGLADAAALVQAAGLDPVALDRTLASLHDQRLRPAELLIATRDDDRRPEIEDLVARWRPRFSPGTIAVVTADAPSDGLMSAARRSTRDQLVLVPGGARLAPDAVALLLAPLAEGATLAYPDEDVAGPDGRHSLPLFRSGFDPDLMLQQDAVGDCLAVRRDALLRHGLLVERGDAALFDFVLRCAADVGADALVHVPRVLLHRPAPPIADEGRDARLAAVRALLPPGATAEAHGDILGADIPGALRVRRPVPDGLTVSIIVPTRDRIDLLAPCLASITASAARNRVGIEVLLVDNDSLLPETHSFLRTAAEVASVRVLTHRGAFNWALINNRAAEQATGEVLVFLNNDTAVLSPDCWDELAAHAIRPEVGAVGARLLFEDGTIQHAGMVTDPWHSFARHEGVGDPGADPGYRGRHALTRRVATVTGACLATRTALFRELGGFDALHFPAEGNDTDYCLRLRARGLRTLYAPAATLYHYESKSRGYNTDEAKRRRAELATATLQQRWAERFADDPDYNPHFDRLRAPCRWLRPLP